MLFVIITHLSGYLGPIHGVQTVRIVNVFAIICDPVFFALSGYFAFGSEKKGLGTFYWNKVLTILLPLVVYSIALYPCVSHFEDISLDGYVVFFTGALDYNWWFIPALVPCLVIAPFLSKGLQCLSDRSALALGAVFFVLFASGLVFTFLEWLFALASWNLLSDLCSLMLGLVPPGILEGKPMLFQFFILGALYRRSSKFLAGGGVGNGLIVLGMSLWAADIVFSYLDIPRSDPSYTWFFTTLGILILFDRIRIGSNPLRRAITWTAKRSYSIYLLQYYVIEVVANAVFAQSLFGVYAEMPGAGRLGVWVLSVAMTYAASWVIASVTDSLLLKNAQRGLFRLFERKQA